MANPRETTISYSEVDTMNVVWKYLDKRAGAVAALKDFSSMKFIIEHTDDEIKKDYDKMSSVGGVRYDGMPHTRNLHATEDRIIKGIEEIDVLKERYPASENEGWQRLLITCCTVIKPSVGVVLRAAFMKGVS